MSNLKGWTWLTPGMPPAQVRDEFLQRVPRLAVPLALARSARFEPGPMFPETGGARGSRPTGQDQAAALLGFAAHLLGEDVLPLQVVRAVTPATRLIPKMAEAFSDRVSSLLLMADGLGDGAILYPCYPTEPGEGFWAAGLGIAGAPDPRVVEAFRHATKAGSVVLELAELEAMRGRWSLPVALRALAAWKGGDVVRGRWRIDLDKFAKGLGWTGKDRGELVDDVIAKAFREAAGLWPAMHVEVAPLRFDGRGRSFRLVDVIWNDARTARRPRSNVRKTSISQLKETSR